jgi:hypothetical protein
MMKCENPDCVDGYIFPLDGGVLEKCPDCREVIQDEKMREVYKLSYLYGYVDRWKRYENFKVGYKSRKKEVEQLTLQNIDYQQKILKQMEVANKLVEGLETIEKFGSDSNSPAARECYRLASETLSKLSS